MFILIQTAPSSVWKQKLFNIKLKEIYKKLLKQQKTKRKKAPKSSETLRKQQKNIDNNTKHYYTQTNTRSY